MELIASNICHRYGALEVLNGISFSVNAGEVVSIVGPSGCGKSTLLSIIGGLARSTSGSVCLRGEVPDGCINPLTYVFQDFALLPWNTVLENIELPLRSSGLDKPECRRICDDVLRRTGLSDFASVYPKQLSGGMKQRVGIARALAVKPAILLMDEPLSALDSQTRELLMDDFIGLLADGSLGAVYVTHNLDEAVRLADRIIILSRRPGRMRQSIEIAIPRAQRDTQEARSELLAVQSDLWALIKNEAINAEREIHGATSA